MNIFKIVIHNVFADFFKEPLIGYIEELALSYGHQYVTINSKRYATWLDKEYKVGMLVKHQPYSDNLYGEPILATHIVDVLQ